MGTSIKGQQCSAITREGYHCPVGAKVIRDGKPYCGYHDPVRVDERRQKRVAKWMVEWDAREAVDRNAVAFDAINKAKDDALEFIYYARLDAPEAFNRQAMQEIVNAALAAGWKPKS